MINYKKIENNLDDKKIEIFSNFKNLAISTLVLENESPFEILVKVGEEVKINQPILKNTDGQKILSDVSGKVLNIKLKEENDSLLTYHLIIENNFKNESLNCNIKPIKTKDDLLNSIKVYGIINKNFLIYKELEATKNTLFIDCYDEPFIYNNFVILSNFLKEIKFVISKLQQILNIEKIYYFTNKTNLAMVREISNYKDKICVKRCRHKAVDMFDLYKIFMLFNNKILDYEILSLTGKALKENKVLFVKKGTSLQEIIDKVGGFKQNIEEVENYKYTAMLAYNDEIELKEKIKRCKNDVDRQKLIKLFEEKKLEAKTNIFDKLEIYHQKYLDCLSTCLITIKNKKTPIKNFNLSIKNNFSGVHFLNNKQFQ